MINRYKVIYWLGSASCSVPEHKGCDHKEQYTEIEAVDWNEANMKAIALTFPLSDSFKVTQLP